MDDADKKADAAPASGVEADDQPRLKAEDQARVDAFLTRGVNSVERKPFRPGLMIIMLITVVMVLSIFSQLLAKWSGIY